MIKKLVVAIVACAIVLAAATPAQALTVPDAVQEEIDRLLALTPGGTQISDTSISWEDGSVIVNVQAPLPGGAIARDIANCPTGNYCAWRGIGYTQTSIWFTACPATSSLAALGGPARSVANARTSGRVELRNGSMIVDTLGASAGRSNVTATTTAMVCFTS